MRPTCSRKRWPTRVRGSPMRSVRSTSAARPGASCACSPPPIPRSAGVDATQTPQRSPGRRARCPTIEFFVSGDAPPLPLADGSLDLVYAISIWSHFEPTLGLRWFEEMHRVLRPGGQLVCTTHGLTSVAFYATLKLRTPEQSQRDRRCPLPSRLVVRAGVRRGRRLGRRQPRLGNRVRLARVDAHATLPALARSGVRPRTQPGQPGRVRSGARLTSAGPAGRD